MPEHRPNRREIAAAATRAEILAAARRLFARDGYSATSIRDIADEAGVALQTVYSSVGSKGALVLALNDLIDEEAGVAELGAQAMGETEPARMIAGAVHLTRVMNERCGDLIGVMLSAQASEPDVAATVANGMQRHRAGVTGLCHGLAAAGALASGVSVDRAAGALAMMTAPASWHQLTQDAGWTFDDAESWLTSSLVTLLLRSKAGGAAKTRS